MRKTLVLFSSLIIAASAAAQTDQAGANAAMQAGKAGHDRRIPVDTDQDKRRNPAAEPPESANSVSPDFQGSSKQESTASGMGQPKRDSQRATAADKTGSAAQDAEDKRK